MSNLATVFQHPEEN